MTRSVNPLRSLLRLAHLEQRARKVPRWRPPLARSTRTVPLRVSTSEPTGTLRDASAFSAPPGSRRARCPSPPPDHVDAQRGSPMRPASRARRHGPPPGGGRRRRQAALAPSRLPSVAAGARVGHVRCEAPPAAARMYISRPRPPASRMRSGRRRASRRLHVVDAVVREPDRIAAVRPHRPDLLGGLVHHRPGAALEGDARTIRRPARVLVVLAELVRHSASCRSPRSRWRRSCRSRRCRPHCSVGDLVPLGDHAARGSTLFGVSVRRRECRSRPRSSRTARSRSCRRPACSGC